MKNLDYKFRKNKITEEELKEHREYINSIEDPELEDLLNNSWTNESINTSNIDSRHISRIKGKIDEDINRKSKRGSIFMRMAKVAVAAVLLVLTFSTIYFYRDSRQLNMEKLIVSTGKNEKANVTLPDGTIVALNSESELSYTPKVYNKNERKIDFEGEGYFEVFKDSSRPFLIDAKGLQVKVLGTTFNLNVRKTKDIAKLTLEEGSVSLLSTQTNKIVILKPSQQAILNQSTGEITVIDNKRYKDASAWRRGDIVFRNTSLSDVIQTIEENYNVKIICTDFLNETFTGTIPINDLNEALEIIERSYSLNTNIKGKEIFFHR